MPPLSTADRNRLFLYNLAKKNPNAIITAIDAIRRAANDALTSTLDSAKNKAVERLEQAIGDLERAYDARLQLIESSTDRRILDAVAAIEPPKGDKGDSPSSDELLRLIKPLIPTVKNGDDGKTPTRDELVALIRPVVIDLLSASQLSQPQLEDPTEAQKKFEDAVTGIVNKIVADRISKMDLYGGGGGGDRVKAGTGVTITTNVIGQKIISATGSGSTVVETPGGLVNSSNTVFTVTAEPKYVVADGVTLFDGAGYTYAGLQITMAVAPSQYIRAVL